MPGVHGSGSGCSCAQEEETGSLSSGANEYLLPYIDVRGIRGLNEREPNSAVKVFKHHSDRLNDALGHCVSCDDDPELMVHVPFVAPCKITSLYVIGGEHGTSPKTVKLFIGHDSLDFLSVSDVRPAQEIELQEDYCGTLEYPLKTGKFVNVSHLTLYFTANHGGDTTDLFYIGLKGRGSGHTRSPVVTVYEARANLADHPVPENHLSTSMGLH